MWARIGPTPERPERVGRSCPRCGVRTQTGGTRWRDPATGPTARSRLRPPRRPADRPPARSGSAPRSRTGLERTGGASCTGRRGPAREADGGSWSGAGRRPARPRSAADRARAAPGARRAAPRASPQPAHERRELLVGRGRGASGQAHRDGRGHVLGDRLPIGAGASGDGAHAIAGTVPAPDLPQFDHTQLPIGHGHLREGGDHGPVQGRAGGWGKGFEKQPVSWGKPSGKSHDFPARCARTCVRACVKRTLPVAPVEAGGR